MANQAEVIIVGGGLAGLSCAYQLSEKGFQVRLYEAHAYLGGRTASWNEKGMKVESGLHRFLGFYRKLPELLRKAGIDLNKMLYWEDEIIIFLKGGISGKFGAAPFFKPYQTIKGIVGNPQILGWKEKTAFVKLMTAGLWDYVFHKEELDNITLELYARQKKVPERLIKNLLTPFSAGIFFLPPSEYSAFKFFGLFAPFLPFSYKTRVGAFMGGMSEVMAEPLGEAIIKKGVRIFRNAPVEDLIIDKNIVKGVVVNGRKEYAQAVVLAVSLGPAQKILKRTLPDHPYFKPMFSMATMPSVTIQMELTERSMPEDRTSFAPETVLASFSEQSHTTFRHVPGRLSVILTPPQEFVGVEEEKILERVYQDAESIGLKLRGKVSSYRVITEKEDFYSFGTGTEALKPDQKTPINGLFLAGDYTRQKYLATMEGAVYSGELAAKWVIKQFK